MTIRTAILFAAATLLPTLAAAEVMQVRYVSTIVAVNEKTNTVYFADRSQALIDKSVPVTREMIGKTVEIGTNGDEDGNVPAKHVRVIN